MTRFDDRGTADGPPARWLTTLRGNRRLFDDRVDAGRQLAEHLKSFRNRNAVVLGLPRGGVPVAFEVAKALGAPLDVLVVRKLGVPFQPELAFGAIGEGGVRVLNDSVVQGAFLSGEDMAAVEAEQQFELARRAERFRGTHDRISLAGRIAVIVDDGVATGATAKAACQVARTHGACRVVLAVPIGAVDTAQRFAGYADEVVCLHTPDDFLAGGQGYRNFAQTSDDEVIALLDRARAGFAETTGAGTAGDPPLRDEEVRVSAGPVSVAGYLAIPECPVGMVVFAHGSGSSRHSLRNRYVAQVLNQAGLATLLFDLLTPEEERNRANVFDIELLAHRLVEVTGWLATQPDTAALTVGYFGASTGAGAALAAADDPRQVRTHRGSRRYAPLRGAGHTRAGGGARPHLVHRSPEPGGCAPEPVGTTNRHGGRHLRLSGVAAHRGSAHRSLGTHPRRLHQAGGARHRRKLSGYLVGSAEPHPHAPVDRRP